jgi:hypothetical protein
MTSTLLLLVTAFAMSGDNSPQWIWGDANRAAGQAYSFRGEFAVHEALTRAQLTAAAEYCEASFHVNGAEVARREPYGNLVRIDVAKQLRAGENELLVAASSVAGPAAIMLRLELQYEDGSRELFKTDETWQVATFDADAALGPA